MCELCCMENYKVRLVTIIFCLIESIDQNEANEMS